MGPDKNLWFTTDDGDIGRVTTAGVVTEYAVPNATVDGVDGIATGPDGNLWFTGEFQNVVGLFYTYGQAFAHIAVGPLGSDVWTTSLILNNTTSIASSFKANFLSDSGQLLQLGVSGIYDETHSVGIAVGGSGQYVTGPIPANGTVTIVLSGSAFAEGWATLSGAGISGQAVFHRHTSTGADYEATVPLSLGGTDFVVPYDATSYYNGSTAVTALPYITGMALANLDPGIPATIICTMLDPNGVSLGIAIPITLPAMGHTAVQLNAGSGFGSLAGKIGSLNCTSNGPLFSVLGLRFLGGNDLTSFAAIKVQ